MTTPTRSRIAQGTAALGALLALCSACSEGSGTTATTGGTGSGAVANGASGSSSSPAGTSAVGGTSAGSSTSSAGSTSSGGLTSGAGGMMNGGGDSTNGGAGAAAAGASGRGAEGGSAPGGAGGSGGQTGGAGAGGAPTNSLGCGKALTRPDPKVQQTIDVAGTTRYYLLDVPSGADNKTPLSLVFGLHGYDMNNVAVVGLFNFTSRSNGKAITVFPQGEGPAPGNTSHWGDQVLKSTWTANDANYAFIEKLMADLKDRFCIDQSRVFITGFSMGGMFTNSIACAHHDWFRGFAPVEGLGPGSCADADAKPAVIVHQGTGDTLVTPDQGEATRDFWAKQNGCSQTTTASFTGCQSFSGCASGSPVTYCVGNWDHTITSTAAANIWSFFSGL